VREIDGRYDLNRGIIYHLYVFERNPLVQVQPLLEALVLVIVERLEFCVHVSAVIMLHKLESH
jgi:hypothetical protein